MNKKIYMFFVLLIGSDSISSSDNREAKRELGKYKLAMRKTDDCRKDWDSARDQLARAQANEHNSYVIAAIKERVRQAEIRYDKVANAEQNMRKNV